MRTLAPKKPATPRSAHDITEHAYEAISDIVHALHLLQGDLDFAFKRERGQKDHDGGIAFMFQETSIEATEWLASEAWNKATNLREQMLADLQALEEAQEAA